MKTGLSNFNGLYSLLYNRICVLNIIIEKATITKKKYVKNYTMNLINMRNYLFISLFLYILIIGNLIKS